ncbi:hypothetical protein CROQUDRAFT_725162 [Cronartium quercuum f. sp. fusiforme G11]|uniref:Beta-xylanase n=1 Tax=Cronartium quercuum f. sp. fusiforme G11 TaxID=708437 RepID=A0A9P6NB37_9BASI|nr:hypothetical protein CROQUDRAFT_725162 [Cronartium quercuum f. sp. fusiforme G11]
MVHYNGKIFALDVCNEIFEEDGSFRDSFWHQKLNESYPEMAFKAARDVGTDVKLYINDYSIEGINKKSDALYKLAKDLREKKLLDGVGFQTHLIVGQVPKDFEENLKRFSALGLDVAITELDIRMPVPTQKKDLEQQARDYHKVASICKSVAHCVGVSVWGVTYKDSWIPQEFPGQGAALLFDANYTATPSFEKFSSGLGRNVSHHTGRS